MDIAKKPSQIGVKLLKEYPVWEFINDDHHPLGDTAMRPVTELPVKEHQGRIFGTTVVLADGTKVSATISDLDSAPEKYRAHFRTMTVLAKGKRFHLPNRYMAWYEWKGPRALAELLEKEMDEVFPIAFDLSDIVDGPLEIVRGVFEAEVPDPLPRHRAHALSRFWAYKATLKRIGTPLMCAAMDGDIALVQSLIAAGAELNAERSYLRRTACDFAEENGHEDVAQLLRQHGALALRPQCGWTLPDAAHTVHVERSVGYVSASSLDHLTNHQEIELRLSRVGTQCEQKLLFTYGLANAAGLELAICLDNSWPLHTTDTYPQGNHLWPAALLYALASTFFSTDAADHFEAAHGRSVPLSLPGLLKCDLPDGHLILLSSLDALELNRDKKAVVPTLLVHFVKAPAGGPTAEWLLATANQKSQASWVELAHHYTFQLRRNEDESLLFWH